jgi:ATP-dependent Lhr-like helicase
MSIVSCDNYKTVLALTGSSKDIAKGKEWSNIPGTSPARFSRRPGNPTIRQKVNQQLQIKSGRWFLTSSFAVIGKTLDHSEQVEKQARLLLHRHGILVKEWYRHEQGFLPWYEIFQVLKRLEWQGEIRRGYFIKGLSGIQFALPQAVELLEQIETIAPNSFTPTMINTADPALPLGGQVDWDLYNCFNEKLPVVRSSGNHIIFIDGHPVCYCENYASRIHMLKSYNKEMIGDIIIQIKSWFMLPDYLRPRKRIEIESINGNVAMGSDLAMEFISQGFEKEVNKLVLWPSGV